MPQPGGCWRGHHVVGSGAAEDAAVDAVADGKALGVAADLVDDAGEVISPQRIDSG
jgi:hypothetical protein